MNSLAVCDIDGNYTNDLQFPELDNEKLILRQLSIFKNFKGTKLDIAFDDDYKGKIIDSDKNFAA